MVARRRPTMDALSARGIRSKSGKVASTCPKGEGSCGNG